MNNLVLAWSDDRYASRLRNETDSQVSVVTSRDRLEKKLTVGDTQRWADVQLVVLMELGWDEPRVRFYGFELVRELLLQDFDRPLMLCSYLEKKQFYSIKGIERFLAPMPFPFVRLPVTPETLVEEAQSADAFSSRLRAYVRENYLAQEPFGRIAHDLMRALDRDDSEMRSVVQRCLENIKSLNVSLPTGLATQRDDVEQALRQGEVTSDEMREKISELRNLLRQHGSPQQTADSDTGGVKKTTDYAVMLVEDDDSYREGIRHGLEPHFEEVFAASSAEEALEKLQTPGRRYMAIVADWLLLEEDGITWQSTQGFDLLVNAWKENAPICLIALTSLDREAVASVLRSTSLEIDWFPKSEVGENTRWPYHAFAGYIRKRVRTLLPDLVNMPEGKWWTEKGLGDLFLELKYESGRWQQVRKNAEDTARQIVRDFYEEETAMSPINEGDYQLKAPGRSTTPDMGHLEKILPQRLAVLALHFEYGQSPLSIRTLLRMEETKPESTVKNRAKQWFSKLGLPREDGRIPESSVMEHEREWLSRVYEVDLKTAELEAQAKSGGTEHPSMATELNSLCTEINGIMWGLGRKYGEDNVPSVGEVKTMEEGMDALRTATNWAEDKRPKIQRFLRGEMQKILENPKNEQVLVHFGHMNEVQDLVDSMSQ